MTRNTYTGKCEEVCHAPTTCHGNGRCRGHGKCECYKGFSGDDCSDVDVDGTGDCEAGFGGMNCEACKRNVYLQDCKGNCSTLGTCNGHGRCRGMTAECTCYPWWLGQHCDITQPLEAVWTPTGTGLVLQVRTPDLYDSDNVSVHVTVAGLDEVELYSGSVKFGINPQDMSFKIVINFTLPDDVPGILSLKVLVALQVKDGEIGDTMPARLRRARTPPGPVTKLEIVDVPTDSESQGLVLSWTQVLIYDYIIRCVKKRHDVKRHDIPVNNGECRGEKGARRCRGRVLCPACRISESKSTQMRHRPGRECVCRSCHGRAAARHRAEAATR